MRKSLAIAGMIIVGWAASAGSLAAQTLDKIKERGVLVVGTKADYKPFGFRDPTGAIIGFEPDLAKDVADKLGVKLELEPVVSSNRMQFLQQGKIDLMIATMNVTEERRKTVGIVEPSYYASGVNVFANRKAGLKRWEQLKDQKICGIQGAFFNKYVAEKYGAEIVAFRGQTGGGDRARSGQLHRLALRRHRLRRAARRSQMGGLRDAAGDDPHRAVGRRGEARGARRAVGAVHGEDHRRLAPQRQAGRAREEVEHRAVGVPEKAQAEAK